MNLISIAMSRIDPTAGFWDLITATPVERKLVAVDKASKFDVSGFKGMEGKPADAKAFLRMACKKIQSYGYVQRVRDAVLMKSVEEL